ncbi:hypothetical protein NEMIN01_0208 [Nematocida minor]|uniref:uncharacterized protein n=1 Tax=Nematocida minor TaxID=1912983 RepID=UPI00221E9AE0|nr:uncharacterized protein NEMIN01_0104 [Nematocida minor]XP_051332110.1 uncharacterized protein NEMIN01_0208 [Nematocida minor]KAI5188840.1 hypothetical protein NEMIN01_0104 [Nematocida minor]KAI5188944.1 hypothetical protein NEMIN01_0208 [Nematocida minor]
MNILAQLQRVLSSRRRDAGRAEKTEYFLVGVSHFKILLGSHATRGEEIEEILRAESLYTKIVEQIQTAPAQKKDLFSLFSPFFSQVGKVLAFLDAQHKNLLMEVQTEATSLLVQQMYVYIEAVCKKSDRPSHSEFTLILKHIPAPKLMGLKMRYLARRAQHIKRANEIKGTGELKETIETELRKYCSLFGVHSLPQENGIALEGFVFSLARSTPGFSEEELKKIQEKMGGKPGDSAPFFEGFVPCNARINGF